jgi:hypothetical protein
MSKLDAITHGTNLLIPKHVAKPMEARPMIIDCLYAGAQLACQINEPHLMQNVRCSKTSQQSNYVSNAQVTDISKTIDDAHCNSSLRRWSGDDIRYPDQG